MSDGCYICGDDRQHVLETHHIVPQRHGGSDQEENLVTLCSSCHSSIESLYDKRFYSELGVAGGSSQSSECVLPDCTSTETKLIQDADGVSEPVCDTHRNCMYGSCNRNATYAATNPNGEGVTLRCKAHSHCGKDGCGSTNTYYLPEVSFAGLRCEEHLSELESVADYAD